MRNYILTLIFCFTFIFNTFAQEKTVYMSVDVSASMKGDKYNLANYTAQMITALMEEQDELFYSTCSDYQKINMSNKKRQEEIETMQKPFQSLRVVYKLTEITDIKTFMQVFNNRPERDQWYFIVGDGYWRVGQTCDDFRNFISQYPIKVNFLETMDSMEEHAHLGECFDDMPFISQYRSSIDPQTIINNCIVLATSLFGVSNESAAIKKESGNCYSFTSEIPIKKIYILYQDKLKTKDLPTLQSASSGNQNIPIARQSVVSTENLISSYGELLSGQVVVLSPSSLLSANQTIKLCFDKEIDPSKLQIFPMVDIQMGKIDYLTETGIPQTEGNQTIICIDNKKVKIVYDLLDSEGNYLPSALLEKTKTKIITETGEYTAKLNNGVFECELPMSDNETTYTINAKCAGYFNITSDKKTISKSEDCVTPIEGEMRSSGSIHLKDVMAGSAYISIQIVNKEKPSEILNPLEYNITVSNDYRHLFKSVEVSNITSEKFDLCLYPRNSLCECFIPDEVTLTVRTEDKTNKFETTSDSFVIPIDKTNTSKLDSCKWIFITMIALFFLILYLRGLNKKKRFKKGAMMRYQYFGVGGIKSRENVDDLRSKGFFSWINRWFVPFVTERASKSFAKANNKVFSFSATTSNQRIEIPKTQYDPKQMNSIDYDRDQFERRDNKTFTMSDNTYIKITLPNGTGSFQLCYDRSTGVKDDIPAFKAFTSIIIFLAVVVEIVMGYLIVSSLF